MSRSIHQNTSKRYWQQRGDHGEADWAAQFRKSRIKRLIRGDRKLPEQPFTPVTPKAIRFSVEQLSRSLFFPATLEDVKGIMDELPPGFLNGVSRVQFEAGRESINAQESIDGQVFDPVLGRKSIEIMPGVYAPIILGMYIRRSGVIQIFAYARDSSAEMNRNCELGLKASMLETVVHELAHNQDQAQRMARGRWHMDNPDKTEAYANRMERELFASVVVPYMLRVYGPPSRED